MTYRFANDHADDREVAAGRVFTGAPGYPAFPVRLADEMFQRCLALHQERGGAGPVTLYDPCCGSAYMLSTAAFLNWQNIHQVIGSDVDPAVLPLAERNLSLLTAEGMAARIEKLEELRRLYEKESHAEALVSARRLQERLAFLGRSNVFATRLFAADATDARALRENLNGARVDVVIVDVPHGRQSVWQGSAARSGQDPCWYLLDALQPILASNAIVAIAHDKAQKPEHPNYRRVVRLQIGKRRVFFFTSA